MKPLRMITGISEEEAQMGVVPLNRPPGTDKAGDNMNLSKLTDDEFLKYVFIYHSVGIGNTLLFNNPIKTNNKDKVEWDVALHPLNNELIFPTDIKKESYFQIVVDACVANKCNGD